MLVVVAFAAGFALGWYRAARRGGTIPDRLQYALAHAIPVALLALAVFTFLAASAQRP